MIRSPIKEREKVKERPRIRVLLYLLRKEKEAKEKERVNPSQSPSPPYLPRKGKVKVKELLYQVVNHLEALEENPLVKA